MKREYLLALLSSYLPMIAYAGSNFILVPVLLKALGERNFGIYMVLYSIAQYMSIGVGWVGGVAIRLIGVYEARKDKEKLKEITGIVFYYFLAYGLVILIASIFILPFLKKSSDIKIAVFFFSVYLFFNYIVQAMVNILFSYNKQIESNVIKTLPVIIYTILTFVLIKIWIKSIIVPVVALLISVILILPYVVRNLVRFNCIVNPFTIKIETIKEVFLSVGFWNFIYGLLLISIMQDRIFLGFFVSPESVAKFTVLWTIPNFLVLVLWRISEVLQPYYVRFSENDILKLKSVFFKNLVYVAVIAMIFSLCYSFFGKKIVSLWVGNIPAFSSTHAFLFAGILIFLLSIERVFSSFFFSLGYFKTLSFILSVTVLVKYLLALVFKNYFMELSTIVSFSIAILVSLLFYNILLKRSLHYANIRTSTWS